MSGDNIIVKSTNITDNVTPSSTKNGVGLTLRDSNDVNIAQIIPQFSAGGVQSLAIYPARRINDTTYFNTLYLGIDASGNATVSFNGNGAQNAWLSALGLDTTAWQTLASGVTYRRHRGWVVVNIDNHAYTGSGSEVALGTLPTGYRPSRWSYNALLGGTTAVPYVSVATDGTVRVNGRASGAKLYGEVVFPV